MLAQRDEMLWRLMLCHVLLCFCYYRHGILCYVFFCFEVHSSRFFGPLPGEEITLLGRSRTSCPMGAALLLDVTFTLHAEFGGSSPPWSACIRTLAYTPQASVGISRKPATKTRQTCFLRQELYPHQHGCYV